MDPITHGITGAAAAQIFSKKSHLRAASITGLVAAQVADFDIFIRVSSNPLLNVEVHRQFTHSLLFIPFGALLVTGLLWFVMKRWLSFKQLYLFSIAGYATNGLLDACTSYGTHLLWPFMESPISWNIISVVDPVFTIGLLIFSCLVIFKKHKMWITFSWAWIGLIMTIGIIQNQSALHAGMELAKTRGHSASQVIVKPTIGNQILWRFMYIYDGYVYTDAIRTGLFKGITVYEGESVQRLDPEIEFKKLSGSVLYGDIIRFQNVSNNYLVWHPEEPHIVGDARYAMLPTEISPLWGIEIDKKKQDSHAPFLNFRDASQEVRADFLRMLLGD